MLVLGIESSCDDTAAAVVEDGRRVLSSIVSSQDEIHARFGGVVPEIASRRHIECIVPVVDEALTQAGVSIKDIGGISVTQGPGLVGSILVGLSFAKSVSYTTGIPFVGINHITAHPYAAFLDDGKGEGGAPPELPLISLIVSGGHTTLVLMEGHGRFRVIGQTLDDAAGEAFDKVAKLLGLGYPGGAAIDALAKDGDPAGVAFKRPYLSKKSLDFSFSGIKTAVLTHLRGPGGGPAGQAEVPELSRAEAATIAASFQEAVVDVLVRKTLRAVEATGVTTVVVAGGVACNSRLRVRMRDVARSEGLSLFIPPPKYCSDNGAMVAASGYHKLSAGEAGELDMNALPTWEGF